MKMISTLHWFKKYKKYSPAKNSGFYTFGSIMFDSVLKINKHLFSRIGEQPNFILLRLQWTKIY